MKTFNEVKIGDSVWFWYPRFGDKVNCIHETEVIDIIQEFDVYHFYLGYHSHNGDKITDLINIHKDNMGLTHTSIGDDFHLFTTKDGAVKFDWERNK